MNIFDRIRDLEKKYRGKGFRMTNPVSEQYIAGALSALSELRDKISPEEK